MARIRTIKPEFWSNDQVAECCLPARLLFIGLWNFCDDGGVHPDNMKQLKLKVFPGDDITTDQIRRLVDELSANGLLRRFTANGDAYLHVTGWERHQKVERPSYKYPQAKDFCGVDAVPSPNERRTRDDDATNDRRAPPPGRESKGREGKGAAAAREAESGPDDNLALLVEACRAAGLPEGRAVNEFTLAAEWARAGYSRDTVLGAIRERAAKPGYQPPRGLRYFANVIAERHAAAAAKVHADAKATPELLARSVKAGIQPTWGTAEIIGQAVARGLITQAEADALPRRAA